MYTLFPMLPSIETTPLTGSPAPQTPAATVPISAAATLQNAVFIPVALIAVLASYSFLPPVAGNPRLVWTYIGLAAGLSIWQAILWTMARRNDRQLRTEFRAVKSHYVQASVQLSLLLWWGYFWRQVYGELPLILSQLIFFYVLDALLSWSRGRVWRLGFGPLPIVISTNLLLWFRHDWYFLQFAMLTVGALAKQFITWNRNERHTHVFNPSAFAQFTFAVVLIATGKTQELTSGVEIARFFDVPHMLVMIFVGGLIVQGLFHVTLMTLAACGVLALLNIAYTANTGLYWFVNVNVAAPIFLGLHLLITDPVTSPRTNGGRVIFGASYAVAYFALYRILDHFGVPTFWDKLLPVPILNLSVPLIDRFVRSGVIGRINNAWESAMSPRRMNLIHMGIWTSVFAAMAITGFIDAPHPGSSISFWKRAAQSGRPDAVQGFMRALSAKAEGDGSGAAFNELGLIFMQGQLVQSNHARAAQFFNRAAMMNDRSGATNVAIEFLFLKEYAARPGVIVALEALEGDALSENQDSAGEDSAHRSTHCGLIGFAYESGRGRAEDPARALAFYERAGLGNIFAVKGRARIALNDRSREYDIRPLLQPLEQAAATGDNEACYYLAYIHGYGLGVDRNSAMFLKMLQAACNHGSQKACKVLESPQALPYSNPGLIIPDWATAFPITDENSQSD